MMKRDNHKSGENMVRGENMVSPLRSGKNRRSIRLYGYDYSQAGAYFVTICTQNRACLFGEIIDGEMGLNDAGRMVIKWWEKLQDKYEAVKIDEYMVMPNHFHGVIIITADDAIVGAIPCNRPNIPCNRPNNKPATGKKTFPGENMVWGENMVSPLRGLGQYVSWFKRMTTNEYIRGVKQNGWPRFDGKLWQRNYWEHIIRNENELNRIRQYIMDNPARWEFDRENPRHDVHAVNESSSTYGNE